MFYISTLKKLYESIKADNSIEADDKQKITELINKLVNILALY
jgi:hypothetical protein